MPQTLVGVGSVIGDKYEVLEMAGEGGMATVWRGTARGAAGFIRPVAIKRIKPEYRAIQNYVDMFVEEARVGAELNHPNIVQVFDFGRTEDGTYFLVMEWIDGLDLGRMAELARRSGAALEWPVVAAIGVGALRGLAAAHERRRPDGTAAPVVHRDVSPSNVLVAASGAVKLSDFGLARARDRMMSFTAPGALKGKLHYLAPEVALGMGAGPLSDQFSLAAVLWEVLAGERLFTGKSEMEVFASIRAGRTRPLGEVCEGLPRRLVAAVHRALSREPADRHPSARQMAVELGECLRDGGYVDQQVMVAARVEGVRAQAQAEGWPLCGADLDQPTWSMMEPPSPTPKA